MRRKEVRSLRLIYVGGEEEGGKVTEEGVRRRREAGRLFLSHVRSAVCVASQLLFLSGYKMRYIICSYSGHTIIK